MLSKKRKLNSVEHKEVLTTGKRKHNPLFTLYFLEREGEDSKCAVVVPKKVAKKAVQRNKNKRKIFDTIKNIYPHILPGYYFILMARMNVEELTQEEIQEGVEDIFKPFLS